MSPYYMIDFSASACLFEIKVNDYPVLNLDVEGQVSTLVPINFAILETGIQKLSARLLPFTNRKVLEPEANLNFNIKLFDVTDDFVFEKQFGNYQSPKVTVSSKLPILKYSSTFPAQVPYRLKAWQDGIDLNDVKDMPLKLWNAYQAIANLIKAHNYDEFAKRLARREKNMATAMYLSTAESKARLNGLISSFKNGFEVMPVEKDSPVWLYANGKVAVLKKVNGDSALYLYHKEKGEELMVDLSFYIPSGGNAFEVI